MPIKSKNDPILDAQMLCQEAAASEEELLERLSALGWHVDVAKEALSIANGIYVEKGRDGLFRALAL